MELKKKHELVPQLQFPPGHRFVPTEQELVDVYLRGKIEGRELPLDVVNEATILEWQPGSLVEAYKGYGENKWYFFTIREPSTSNKENEPNRKVRVPGVNATWKATGSVTAIRDKGQQGGKPGDEADIIGTKRVLIYHSSDPEEDGKWSMHEYVLMEHAKIGQYALCSIRRKQHSDTEDNGGEGSSSKGKRQADTDMDSEKIKKKVSTGPEGAQLQHQEATAAEPPLKPRRKTTKTKTGKATKGKKKAQTQEEEGEQEQQQQQQGISPDRPTEPPLTPPQQQEQQLLAAYSATDLPTVPLQGYPSYPNGNQQLGASAPMHKGDASFLCDDMSQFLAQDYALMFYSQGEQQPSFTGAQFASPDSNVVDHAQHQLYRQQEDRGMFGVQNQSLFFGGNQSPYTGQYLRQNDGQNSSDWEHGRHQVYQQEESGGAFVAQDQHADAQCYDQFYGQGHGAVFGHGQAGHGSDGQYITQSVEGHVASGGDHDLGFSADDSYDPDLFLMSMLRDDDPQGMVGTQEGVNPAGLAESA